MVKLKNGFTGERALVLPRMIVDKLEEDPLTSMLHITDIGYYPKAKHHFRERKEPINQYVFIYCIDGAGWLSFLREFLMPMLLINLLHGLFTGYTSKVSLLLFTLRKQAVQWISSPNHIHVSVHESTCSRRYSILWRMVTAMKTCVMRSPCSIFI